MMKFWLALGAVVALEEFRAWRLGRLLAAERRMNRLREIERR